MKKKTSVYIFFPILLLVLFSAYYWNFSSGYEQKQAAKAAEVKRVHDEKVVEDNRLRLKAINDALAVQDRRKAERKAKAERLKKEQEEMANAVVARDHANSEATRFREKYERLVKDVQTEKDEIERITHDKGELQTQLDFLKILTAKAEGNVQSLATVLNQIAAADTAYASAAKAAAAAAAKAKQ
jgi:hypothetical protein